jgi:serine/threonine protein kinase
VLDIKPDNILWNPEKNKLLLIDFGLSSSIKNVDVMTL